jgi:hypothetical protein
VSSTSEPDKDENPKVKKDAPSSDRPEKRHPLKRLRAPSKGQEKGASGLETEKDRRELLKRLTVLGLGAAATTLVGARVLAPKQVKGLSEAISGGVTSDATYLVRSPHPDLPGELLPVRDYLMSGWDYLVYADSDSVKAFNPRTLAIDYTSSSAERTQNVLQSIVDGAKDGALIFVHPGVPATVNTLTIEKSDITVFCPKRNAKDSTGPYIRKIVLGRSAQSPGVDTKRIWLHGIAVDELELTAPGNPTASPPNHWQGALDGITVEKCMTSDLGVPGRRGLRFTGYGDIENVAIRDHYATVGADDTHFMSIENASLGSGHWSFERFWGENAGGHKRVDGIVYSDKGRTGTNVEIGGSFVFIGDKAKGEIATDCHIVHLNQGSPEQDCGPAKLYLRNMHFELQTADMDLILIDPNPGGTYCNIILEAPLISVAPTSSYRWLNNLAQTFVFQSSIQVWGGGQLGSGLRRFQPIGPEANQSTAFTVAIRGFVGYNPLGALAMVAPASGTAYVNNDGVAEIIHIDGGAVTTIVKDGVTLYNFAGAAARCGIPLEPGESLTINYTTAPTCTKDRK